MMYQTPSCGTGLMTISGVPPEVTPPGRNSEFAPPIAARKFKQQRGY